MQRERGSSIRQLEGIQSTNAEEVNDGKIKGWRLSPQGCRRAERRCLVAAETRFEEEVDRGRRLSGSLFWQLVGETNGPARASGYTR